MLEQTFTVIAEEMVISEDEYGFKTNTAFEDLARSCLLLLSLKCIIHIVVVHKPGINLFQQSSQCSFFAALIISLIKSLLPVIMNKRNPSCVGLIWKSSSTALANRGVLSSKIMLFD